MDQPVIEYLTRVVKFSSFLFFTLGLISFIKWIIEKFLAPHKNFTEPELENSAKENVENSLSDSEDFTHLGNNSDSNRCDLPECVRCQKYEVIQYEAPKRMREFFNGITSTEFMNKKEVQENLKYALNNKEEFVKREYQDPNVLFYPHLDSNPWWDASYFEAEVRLLEKNVETIYEEYISCSSNSSIANEWLTNKSENGRWDVFHLYNQGVKQENNCAHCPKTTELIEFIPTVIRKCVFGNVFFSVLHPFTTISAHCGPSNTRIRCHLGLQIPISENAQLSVGKVSRTWEDGKCILFDDSFLHSSANNTESYRIVLIIDFWHPQIDELTRKALQYIY